MPRLPDITGARPVPVSRASVTSFPGAGAVGDAVAGLGNQLTRMGQEAFEKEDRLNYAAAKATYLKADVEARRKLQDDPDYETYESRYAELMKPAQDAARGVIKSSADRALFDTDITMDYERGRGQVLEMARGRRVSARKATNKVTLDSVQDAGLLAADEPTRWAAIGLANEAIDAGLADGTYTAEEATSLKMEWANGYVSEQIRTALLRDDLGTAEKYFDTYLDKLSPSARIDIATDLTRRRNGRQAAVDAISAAPGFAAPKDGKPSGDMFTAILGIEGGTGKNGEFLTSPKGAVGPAQVMPATAPEAAKLAGLAWDEKRYRSDPEYNKALGEAYFNKQLRTFGDPELAAAAYNAGPGAVEKALKKGGDWLQHLPDETQKYVANFRKRTGYGGGRVEIPDQGAWLSQIEARGAKEGWSFERVERAKDYARQEISGLASVRAQREGEADRQASEVVLGMGEGFKDVAQIPRSVWSNLSPNAREAYTRAAEANRKPKDVEANGPEKWRLTGLQYSRPEEFAKLNLGQYIGKITNAEMDEMLAAQARIRNPEPKSVSIRSNISATIEFFKKMDPELRRDLDPEKQPEAYSRVYQDMEQFILSQTGGKRDPSDAEAKLAFDRATMKVMAKGAGWFGGSAEQRRYEVKPGQSLRVDIPASVRQRIEGSLRRVNGRFTEDDVTRVYIDNKGKPGFW